MDSSIPSELTAIILAGSGNRLYPLCEDTPKALLPIANKPMISYALDWLEKLTIVDTVLIACFPRDWEQINNYVEVYETTLKVVRVVQVAEEGTLTAIRALSSMIKTDFLVMPCDIITDLPSHNLINPYRALYSAMTCILYDAATLEPTEKLNKDDADIIGLDPATSDILLSIPRADVMDEEEFSLKKSLLLKFPRINIHTQLRDAHLFIFKHWVLELILREKEMTSIRLDLVPMLLELQYKSSTSKSMAAIRTMQIDLHADIFAMARSLSLNPMSVKGRVYSISNGMDEKPTSDPPPPVKCTAVIYRKGLSARSNTPWSYGEINRVMIKTLPSTTIPETAEIAPGSQVGQDCLIGGSAVVGARTSLKRSVVGAHVKIGKNVKIVSCVIMDYAVVEDGAKLENCILSRNCKVSSKSELKDCMVAVGFVVDAETHAKGRSFFNIMDDEEGAE